MRRAVRQVQSDPLHTVPRHKHPGVVAIKVQQPAGEIAPFRGPEA